MYMIMPMGKKVLAKIENIVREEMDAKDAQELLMPALIPEEVYIKSGRREVFGSNMFTMNDRYMKRYVLGPTHEELFAVAASMDGKSYKDFPYNLYQIQTKFRDETRPRYGLIRVREFIMKDAYTFDIDEAGLDEAYAKMYDAYCRIFDRIEKVTHARVGFAGPVGLDCPVYMDRMIKHMKNFIIGANKSDHHYVNVNLSDFTPELVADLCQVKEGDICPVCGKPLTFQHGIEVGNLFKLGTKYAQSMNLYYTDANNQLQPVWMGSYGIGLERCMAAIVEQHHDDKGIIWPKEVAPFILSIVPISLKDEKQMEIANDLYNYCTKNKYSVLLDDRNERPGVKFKDMELIGIPYRITVGRKAQEGILEFSNRYTGEKEEVSIDSIKSMIDELYKA